MKYRSFLVGVLVAAKFSIPAYAQQPTLMPDPTAKVETENQKSAAAGSKVRRAVPDTLMFSIDEFNDIKDRMAGGEITQSERNKDTLDVASLYLGSIMYSGPKDWVIWINGAPVGPSQDFQSFQVTEITPRYVELLVPLSSQGMRPVRLEPNQTFITQSGLVVEGRYP